MRALTHLLLGLLYGSPLSAQALLSPVHATRCPSNQTAGFPFNAPDSLRRAWYGQQFRALGEKSLCAELAGARQVVRLVWVPSFHPSVAVKVRDEGDKHVVRAKKLSGAGGYEPGNLIADTTFVLTEAQWDSLTSLISQSGF